MSRFHDFRKHEGRAGIGKYHDFMTLEIRSNFAKAISERCKSNKGFVPFQQGYCFSALAMWQNDVLPSACWVKPAL
jgi:hypothetical protein